MKTKKFLCAFITAACVCGAMIANAQTKIYVHHKNGTAAEYTISDIDSISFTPKTVVIPDFDYSNLLLNEIDGNGKFVELYNKGTEAISLEGLTLIKNEDTRTDKIWWTGEEGTEITAGGYYAISTKDDGDADPAATENTGASGISPKKNVKFELKNGSEVIDFFVRTTTVDLDANVTPDYGNTSPKYSFGRVAGEWMLTIPTCNAVNSASQGAIVTE